MTDAAKNYLMTVHAAGTSGYKPQRGDRWYGGHGTRMGSSLWRAGLITHLLIPGCTFLGAEVLTVEGLMVMHREGMLAGV
jgi:hypothetical protein